MPRVRILPLPIIIRVAPADDQADDQEETRLAPLDLARTTRYMLSASLADRQAAPRRRPL